MTREGLFCDLSLEADNDIEDIFKFTKEEFGLEKAVSYFQQFDMSFAQIIENPVLGRERSDIREGLRSIIQGSHVIFYRILEDRIRIVRVLHGSRDLPTILI